MVLTTPMSPSAVGFRHPAVSSITEALVRACVGFLHRQACSEPHLSPLVLVRVSAAVLLPAGIPYTCRAVGCCARLPFSWGRAPTAWP